MNLDQLRKKINKIDAEILNAFQKRKAVSIFIGEYKKSNGLAIHQPKREEMLLSKLCKLGQDKNLEPKFISKVFKTVFAYSRSIQRGLVAKSKSQKLDKNSETIFAKEVYAFVKKIKKGKTMTYKEVAVAIGKPKASRAIGNILNKNHNPEIPCHRVVRSDGSVGGFNRGSRQKIKILKSEGAYINFFK